MSAPRGAIEIALVVTVFLAQAFPAHGQHTGPRASSASSAAGTAASAQHVASVGPRQNLGANVRTRPAGSMTSSRSGRAPQRSWVSEFDGSEGLQNLLNLTPNSGFDYQFLNAVNGDLGMKALIDPVTQLEIAQASRFAARFHGFPGAYILGGGGYYFEAPAEADGQASTTENGDSSWDVQQQNEQQSVEQQPGDGHAQSPAATEDPASQIPDEGQFTLVLNDGRQIPTSAFSHNKDRIIYITANGGRASIAFSDLDAEATVRINQEHGTPLQLPL